MSSASLSEDSLERVCGEKVYIVQYFVHSLNKLHGYLFIDIEFRHTGYQEGRSESVLQTPTEVKHLPTSQIC